MINVMKNSLKELLAKSFPTLMQFDEFGDLVPSVCDMSVRFEENEHVRVIILKEDEYNKLKYDAD